MKLEDKLKELEEKKKKMPSFIRKLDRDLKKKKITKRKYNSELKKQYTTSNKKEIKKIIDQEIEETQKKIKKHKRVRTEVRIIGVVVIFLAVFAFLSDYIIDDPTGFAVSIREEQVVIDYNRVFNHFTETELEITNITSLRISGVLDGTGATVKLRINNSEYLIADIVIPDEAGGLITGMVTEEEQEPTHVLSTDKPEYALGETVTITLEPDIENKSLYVNYGDETEKLEGNNYITQNVGGHQVVVLIVLPDDILRLETNFTVINETINITINETGNETGNQTNETEEEPETTGYEFTALCTETCTLTETSNPILIVEVDEGSTLTVTEIIVTQNKENQGPEQVKNIPDMTIATSQTATVDLSEYFTDPDEDMIAYDINEIPEIDADVSLDMLTISSSQEGVYTAYIYATDGDKLVTSNTFFITITEANTSEHPAELNVTAEADASLNKTGNETNTTETPKTPPGQIKDPCKHPDPNKRPIECVETQTEEYYVQENVFLQNSGRGNIARITPIGNIVIKGQVFENSVGSPGPQDFQVTVRDSNLDFVATAWIDSDTGNLHLKGLLYEEDFFLEPTPNAYVIQNKRNVNLAYINRKTGDLHLKGNLIQNREEIE